MMKACKCGSYAINHHCHGRDGSDDDLCDVCYWRKRAEQPAQQEQEPICKLFGTLPVYDRAAQQEPVAWIVEDQSGERLEWASDAHSCHGVPTFPLYTSPPAQRPHECSRSHPHENMDAMCELRTEIARLTNENARLKAQPQQEPFGYLYEGTAEHTRHKTVFEKTRAERFETRWWREIGPCYTSPPAQRTWVGLEPGEISKIATSDPLAWANLNTVENRQYFARAIEAKLKGKNT